MFLENETDIEDEEIFELIDFIDPLIVVTDLTICIDDQSTEDVYGEYFEETEEIIIHVPREILNLSRAYILGKAEPKAIVIYVNNWKEYFIAIFTHELEHYFQDMRGEEPNEISADNVAALMVDKYRTHP